MPLYLDFLIHFFLIKPTSLLRASLVLIAVFLLASPFPFFKSIIPKTLQRSHSPSQCLLSAVRVIVVMVVLSLCLLVTKEVAPPASRVVHPSVLCLLYSLYGVRYKVNMLHQETGKVS